MILDYIPSTDTYTLKVSRRKEDPQRIMREHGLDLSLPRSTPDTALLFTQEPYAALSFFECGTPVATAQLFGLRAELARSWELSSSGHLAVPADKQLWPLQAAGVEYCLSRRHALIGDQPGVGKTAQAIVYCNERRARHVLVLCPANIRGQWAKQITAWSTMQWPYYIHIVATSARGVYPTGDRPGYNIVSYDLARSPVVFAALMRGSYDVLILDEAHYLKTGTSRRSRAVFGHHMQYANNPHIAQRSQHVLALTGTPLPNRPREAYTLARGLAFGAIDWQSEEAFRDKYNPINRRDVVGGDGKVRIISEERTGRHAELQNRLRVNFMVRRLKRDALPQLALPVYDIIQLEETGPVKEALHAERLLDIDPEHLEGADMSILGHVSAVRKQMGLALAPQVADYVDMLMFGGEEKLVVFGWHIEVLNLLQLRLAQYGLVRIDGSTSPAQRERAIEAFTKDPYTRIVLGNIQSMGVGTDGLQTVCNHALIAEPSWTPADNEQAFDRLDRGGQTRQVQGEIFCAPGSFAERILAAALRKMRVIHNAMDRR
jgi:SWI/SNF-related matrix-associated actin-dependent regulator of chromatin subfamily A-like protein 1